MRLCKRAIQALHRFMLRWNIVRDFNYVYLDSADSLEILEAFDNLSE